MWHTHIARSVAELDRLGGTWEHLYTHSKSATLFQRFAWNRLACERFAARESPYVVFAESDAGAALIPAAITRTGITMLGETLFDYRNLLWAGSDEVLHAAWAKLAELHLPLAFTGLRGVHVRDHWSALQPQAFTSAPQVLRSQITAGAFTQQHSILRRTLRRLSHAGVSLCEHTGSDSELLACIYRLKAQQIDTPQNVFRDAVRREFMVAASAIQADSCQIFTLECRSTLVAALVTFRDRDLRRFYTIYFDRGWARYSPGTALLFEVTRRTLEEGLDCDYMTGEQPHKRRFMTSAVPLFQVDATAEVVEAAALGISANAQPGCTAA